MLENSSSAQTADKSDISSAQISITSLEYEIRGNKLYVGDKSLEEIVGIHSQDKVAPEYRMDPLAIKQLLLMQEMLTSGNADMVCLPSPDDLYIYQREGNKVKLISLRMPAEMQVEVMKGLGAEVKLTDGNIQVPFEAVIGKPGTKEISIQNIPKVLLSLTGINYDFKDTFRLDERIFQNESIKFNTDVISLPLKNDFPVSLSPYIPAEINSLKYGEVVVPDIKKDRVSGSSELAAGSDTVRFFHLKKNAEARESDSKNGYKAEGSEIKRTPLSRVKEVHDSKARIHTSRINQGMSKPERVRLLAERSFRPVNGTEQFLKKLTATAPKSTSVGLHQNFQNTGIKNPAAAFTKIQNAPLDTVLRRVDLPVSKIITASSLPYIKKPDHTVKHEKRAINISRKKMISSSFVREERKQITPSYLSKPKQKKSAQLRTLKVKSTNIISNVRSQQRVQIKSTVRNIIVKTLKTAGVSISKIKNTAHKILLYAKKILPESLVVKISKNLKAAYQAMQRGVMYLKRSASVFVKPFRPLLGVFRRLSRLVMKTRDKKISESTIQRGVFRLRKSVIKARPALSVRNFIRNRSRQRYLLLKKKIRRLQLIRRNIAVDQEMLWYLMREAEKNKRKLRKIKFADRTKQVTGKSNPVTFRNKI